VSLRFIKILSFIFLIKPLSALAWQSSNEPIQPPKQYRLSYDFGAVQINSPKETHWNLKAKNSALMIKSISVLGENFKLNTNCPSELPALEKCTVGIVFTPTTEGPHQGTLLIDLYSEIFTVEATGQGSL
jgi:hypothetical protein